MMHSYLTVTTKSFSILIFEVIFCCSLFNSFSRSSIIRNPNVSGRLPRKSFIILLSLRTLFMSSENELKCEIHYSIQCLFALKFSSSLQKKSLSNFPYSKFRFLVAFLSIYLQLDFQASILSLKSQFFYFVILFVRMPAKLQSSSFHLIQRESKLVSPLSLKSSHKLSLNSACS